jgi:hypothetical protein
LTNLDAIRVRAVAGNGDAPAVAGMPATDDDSMRPKDSLADANIKAKIPSKSQPSDSLIFTTLVNLAHAPLADEDTLAHFFTEHAERLAKIVRPAYGTFTLYRESVQSDDEPAPDHRDPRISRDRLHDMRMPPYMRDETAGALSLTHRQYTELVTYLTFATQVLQKRRRAAAAGAGPEPISTPLRRRIAARLTMIDGTDR